MFTIGRVMIAQKKITRRQRQKEDTKRIILDAAYFLFAEKGYTKTTMRMLAGQAGVGLGTIFKHFPDKPSLLVAAYQEDLGKIIVEAVANATGQYSTPLVQCIIRPTEWNIDGNEVEVEDRYGHEEEELSSYTVIIEANGRKKSAMVEMIERTALKLLF